jgi:hypothetical protein
VREKSRYIAWGEIIDRRSKYEENFIEEILTKEMAGIAKFC